MTCLILRHQTSTMRSRHMLTSASNQSRRIPVQRATVVLARQRNCSGTLKRIWNHILRLDICSCCRRMPSWSLELVPGPSEAEQSRQLQIKRPRVDMSSQGTGRGLEVAGAPSTKQGTSRSPSRRTREGRQAETPNDPGLVSLVLSLEARLRAVEAATYSVVLVQRETFFTVQKHEGACQEVRAAGGSPGTTRARSGQSAPPCVPGPPVHTGQCTCLRKESTKQCWAGSRASKRCWKTGRMGHDVPSRGLLRQASAGETGSHLVRHERNDGSVVAPFRPEASNPASSSWAAPASRRDHDEADERTERARLALVRARREAQGGSGPTRRENRYCCCWRDEHLQSHRGRGTPRRLWWWVDVPFSSSSQVGQWRFAATAASCWATRSKGAHADSCCDTIFVDDCPRCTWHDHLLSELTVESNAKSKNKKINLSVCSVNKLGGCSLTGLPVLWCCSVHELRGNWLSYLGFPGFFDAVEVSTSGVFSLHRETKLTIGFDFAVALSSPESFCVLFDIISEQLVGLKLLMLNKYKRWFHSSRVKFP